MHPPHRSDNHWHFVPIVSTPLSFNAEYGNITDNVKSSASPRVGWGPAKTQTFLARDRSTSEVHTVPKLAGAGGVPTMGPWLLVPTRQMVTLTPTSQPGTLTCRI